MQRSLIAFVGVTILSLATISAEQKAGTSSGSGANGAAGPTVTYTGCLVAGSSTGTYALISASEKGNKKNKDNGKLSLVVLPADPKVSLEPQLSHAVEITGTVTATGAVGGATSDVPVLTASKVKWHADFCG